MLFKNKDGKLVEILRTSYKDDKAYYLDLMYLKGYLLNYYNRV